MSTEPTANQEPAEDTSAQPAFQPLSSQEIQQILPHRFPFLLVDRIIALDERTGSTVGLKAVSGNEPWVQGHFPGYPVMPGVLIAEALAQVGAVGLLRRPEFKGRLAFLAGLENFRFRRQVVPGDILRLEVTLIQLRRGVGRAQGKALVDGKVAAEGEILFAIGPATP